MENSEIKSSLRIVMQLNGKVVAMNKKLSNRSCENEKAV